MYEPKTGNERSVNLLGLFVGLGVAFTVGFGALCFATNSGHDSPAHHPQKQANPAPVNSAV
jgi:hypothetical protein